MQRRVFSEPEFEEVIPGSLDLYSCSPEVGDDFVGIRLAAPRIVYSHDGDPDELTQSYARAVVCVTWQFPHETLGLNGDFSEEIIFVATNTKTHVPHAGRQREDGTVEEPPPPDIPNPVTHEDYAGVIETGWMNPSLFYVLDIPAADAEYHVFATLGPYKSNVVTLSIEPDRE